MKKQWFPLVNVFLNVTNNSFRLAQRISNFHYSALLAKSADPFILGLYTVYVILHKKYEELYAKWISQTSLQIGDTAALYLLLVQLSNEKINAWDAAIANVYARATTTYKSLLAHGHKPFQHGTQEDRISAILALLTAIGTDVTLATVKADIQAFYDTIKAADTKQKGSISNTKTCSDVLEAARKEMCIGQYADLGGLMQQYAKDPTPVETFFDVEAIRSRVQLVFTGSVKKLSFKSCVKRTFADDAVILLENNGVTTLRFYKALTVKDAIGTQFIEVLAGKQEKVNASAIGDVAFPFLMVYNPDTINKGDYTIEII